MRVDPKEHFREIFNQRVEEYKQFGFFILGRGTKVLVDLTVLTGGRSSKIFLHQLFLPKDYMVSPLCREYVEGDLFGALRLTSEELEREHPEDPQIIYKRLLYEFVEDNNIGGYFDGEVGPGKEVEVIEIVLDSSRYEKF